MSARLDPSEHAGLPWRINEVASDFKLIDAWTLPAEGDLDEFAQLCAIFANLDLATDKGSKPSAVLFKARSWLGERLDWDDAPKTLPIPGCEEVSLRQRLPADLEAETDETAGKLPFRPVYRTDIEWALELSNATVHAVLHLGWTSQSGSGYRGQMGVYVKTRGVLGSVYMAAIAPFRYFIVYPALIRRIDRAWRARTTK